MNAARARGTSHPTCSSFRISGFQTSASAVLATAHPRLHSTAPEASTHPSTLPPPSTLRRRVASPGSRARRDHPRPRLTQARARAPRGPCQLRPHPPRAARAIVRPMRAGACAAAAHCPPRGGQGHGAAGAGLRFDARAAPRALLFASLLTSPSPGRRAALWKISRTEREPAEGDCGAASRDGSTETSLNSAGKVCRRV